MCGYCVRKISRQGFQGGAEEKKGGGDVTSCGNGEAVSGRCCLVKENAFITLKRH